MSIDNQRKLVRLLAEKTGKKELQWAESVSPGVFQSSVGKNFVQIQEMSRRGATDIQISLLNSDGDIVDKFTDVEIEQHDREGNPVYFSIMNSLFNSSRRNASGADQILEDILNELDDIPF